MPSKAKAKQVKQAKTTEKAKSTKVQKEKTSKQVPVRSLVRF
jgi:hypothetical protein